MATAEGTRRTNVTPQHVARDPAVFNPLNQLRSTIRRYILLEGVLSACLFAVAWFALGLVLDFVFFKVTGVDWVLAGHWCARVFLVVVAFAVVTAIVEGMIAAAVFFGASLTLGLVEYLCVSAFGSGEWVEHAPLWFRLGTLLWVSLPLAAVIGFRLLRRLTKELSYETLALVLERRFPKLLGDRLITAVEMGNVNKMKEFGYSEEMLLATIAEARERVAQVPVSKVFNWRRLWLLGFASVALVLGTVTVGIASHALAARSVQPARAGWKLAHVSGIFLERNVGLMSTPWPRRAHIELVGFPETEATVSRDVATVPITARAYKWVVADPSVRAGWRPMKWGDVTPELIGRDVPAIDAAALLRPDDTGLPAQLSDWYVDAVEARLFVPADAPDDSLAPEALAYRNRLREGLGSNFDAAQQVFAALNAAAERPSMERTLRKLELTRPEARTDENGAPVVVQAPLKLQSYYRGLKFKGKGDLTPKQNNEYAGDVSGLKEDVYFYVEADDFQTPAQRIRLIPPPTLKRLYRVQEEPAYLHHAPATGTGFEDLRGRRQVMGEKNLSLTGERSVFVVPAGTQVTIHADPYTDDDGNVSDNDAVVSAVAIPVVGKFPGAVFGGDGKVTQTPVPLAVTPGKGWTVTFRNGWDDYDAPTRVALSVLKGIYPERDGRANVDFRLKDPVEFKVTWTNKYNVSTTRSILIQVTQDQPPVVEVGVDVIRKLGNTYLVTPKVRIPFNPDSFIKDDHGLSKVEYTFTYSAEDSDVVRGLRTKYALRSLLDLPTGAQFPAAVLPRLHADNFRTLDKNDDRLTASVFVSEWANQNGRLRRETPDRLAELLKTPSGDDVNQEAVRKVELKNSDRDYFDLKELNDLGIIKILAPPGEAQQSYRMDLFVQATDNNADHDGGPRVTRGSEPIRLRVVSEGDLLLEISKEEEALGLRLDEALAQLAAAKRAYEFVRSSNGFKEETPEVVDTVKVRSQTAVNAVDKSRDIVNTVLREFRRIARECEVNRVVEVTTKNYQSYCARLDTILSEDPNASVAFPKTLNLLNVVQAPLNTSRWASLAAVTDAEQSLYALERELQAIRKDLGESLSKEQFIKNLRKLRDDQLRVEKDIEALKRQFEDEQGAKTAKVSPVGAIALTKGETKKVQHAITWRQYKEDELIVKLTSSDPAVVVPAQLTLTYENNQFRFEYEVKAGSKEGTYKITVTPGAGEPVEVTVIVK
ncbi:hypothetical protein R5W24_001191 [Gemmata sp. JC717]|uniref:hypothetical protein n=1 Tax=Gemmata algarum TaxID=2975278 RepID=UPI0021BAC299|nr:hypothetical protein [Gemmata algarum]MDY3552111.1 hypothetical protein [Gemmata algarum]